jgi:hypothetical protein
VQLPNHDAVASHLLPSALLDIPFYRFQEKLGMLRPLCFSAFLSAMLVGQAQAIELFTNFHYGENVGFPSMNVPVRIYGGIGRGGWNCRAIDQIPVKSIPPEPAVTPTGCTPAHAMGCKDCGSAWNGYGQQAWGKHARRGNNGANLAAQAPVYQYDSEPTVTEGVQVEPGVFVEETDNSASPTPLEAKPGVPPEEVSAPEETNESVDSTPTNEQDNRWPKGEALFPQDGI